MAIFPTKVFLYATLDTVKLLMTGATLVKFTPVVAFAETVVLESKPRTYAGLILTDI
jgi:hypothetical protein